MLKVMGRLAIHLRIKEWLFFPPSQFSNLYCSTENCYSQYQGEFERIYASTFHARDNYQLIFDMLTKFHIPPSVAQHFDAREHWPLCRSSTAKVYDQGACWNYWVSETSRTCSCLCTNYFVHHFSCIHNKGI